MGKFMRKCKGIGEVAVMEVQVSHQVGVRTRARTKTLAAATSLAKRRKFPSSSSTQEEEITRQILRMVADSDQCSSSGSLRSVIDLEECNELENSPYRERSASPELLHHPHNNSKTIDLDSSTETPSPEVDSRHNSMVEKMPTESEIEEFFAVAEEDEKKRFESKYNYDIEKDVPLEGRFEWVPLKQ